MSDVTKGERFNLTKGSGGATDFYIGLGWNAGQNHDLDASVFCTTDQDAPKLVTKGHFVYFSNLRSPDGGVVHSGDNLTGDGDGDDEQIRIHLSKLDAKVDQISIFVCLYDAKARGQNFGQVNRAYVQVAMMDSSGNPKLKADGTVDNLVRFPLSDDYSAFTAVQVGSIYKRDDGDWAFNPMGVGIDGEIGDIVAQYAIA